MAKLTKKAVKALAVPKAAMKRSKRIDRPAGGPVAAHFAKKKIKAAITATKPADARAMPPKRSSNTDVTATSSFVSRARVAHRMFGPGTVLTVDGDKLEIKFKSVGIKWILDCYVIRA